MSFKGKKNVYLCRHCGHGFITQDVHIGVRPFMVPCQNEKCGEMATSCCYNIPQDFLAHFNAAFEWYKPTMAEATLKGPGTVDHVKKGGLIMRPAQEEDDHEPN